jgi:hypothetical protein
MSRLVALVAVFATALALAGPVSGQAASTTGSIRGQVLQQTGAPAVTAIVTALNTGTGLERTALTNEDGRYVLRLLPPGQYTVSTQVIGFANSVREAVPVAIGQTTSVDFTIAVQAIVIEGIEVQAQRDQIDASGANVAQLVNVDQIESLPSLGRDFVDFIELSGFVTSDPGETTGGQFSIAGQRPSGTNVQIDGVDANNSFFGENRGGSRIPFVFSLESIDQFQIITNGYDVEYGSYSGGIVNVVTRGGTNEFEGTVYGNFRDDALVASGFEAEDPGSFEVQQYAARVSGPIIRDKAHFLFSLDGQRRREPQIPLSLANQDPALSADIERFFDILENQYGVQDAAAGYAPFATRNDVITLFGRVDWNLNADNRLTLRHNFADHDNGLEYTDFFDFTYGRSRAESFSSVSNSFVAELQSVLSDNAYNVFRFQWADENRPRQGQDVRPTLTVRVPGIDALNSSDDGLLRYGGTFVAFRNLLDEQKLQFIDNLTYSAGDHTLKVGGNALITTAFNRFQAPMSGIAGLQSAGEFGFASLDDFAAGNPDLYLRPFQQGERTPGDEFDVVEWSAYVQDEWRMNDKLTATLGLRYDQQSFSNNPDPVADIEGAFGFKTGFAPTDSDNFSPRLSLAYDLNADGRTVLRAGAGYFYGRIPLVLGGNVIQTQRPLVELRCEGAAGDPDAPPSLDGYSGWSSDGSDNPFSCRGGSDAVVPTPTYTVWSEDFEYPETFRANVGFETAIGDDSRLSVDVLFTQGYNQYNVRNLNLRPEQFRIAGEDRPVYTPIGVFSPGGDNGTASRINTDFSNVYAVYSDGQSRAYLANVEYSRNFGASTRLTGSYTFNRAYDNISVSCCTSNSLYEDPRVGATSPNDLGDIGDTNKAWGISSFSRDHNFILSGQTALPLGIELAGFWRLTSGRRFTPVVNGDLNGDGIDDNDLPFVYAASNLPLASAGTADEAADRAAYQALLDDNACLSDAVGSYVQRNSCAGPWTNRLDLKLSREFATFSGQRAELQIDLFNVANGVGRLFCSDEDQAADPFDGPCGWGRITTVTGDELYDVASFDRTNRNYQYRVTDDFGEERTLGDNLLLQFQMQIGFRYYF